jgi:hypothetical protein
MTTFSDNKLPLPSQPWGREVTKAITSLESKVESERINNTARDNQLNSSIIANQAATIKAQSAADDAADAASAAATAASTANAAATTANNAINAITGLGTPGSSTTVNASNISGGNITGVTFRTAASGQRVELSGTSETFYNSSGYTGAIYGSVDQGSNAITTTSGAGQLSVFGYGGAGGGVFMGGSGVSLLVGDGNLGTVISSQGTTYINGGAFRSNASTNTIANALTVSGSCDINGGYAKVGTGFLQVPDTRTRSATGGLAMFVAANGTYHVGSSSRRYKTDIENYAVNVDDFLSMQPVTFRYKSEVEEVGDAAGYTTGFIAEDFDDAGLTEYVVYSTQEDGTKIPEGIQYEKLAVGLHSVISSQQSTIDSLIARIEALESKV